MGSFARRVLGLQLGEAPAPKREDKLTKQHARQVVDAWEMPYFKELLARLEARAQEPIEVSGDMSSLAEKVGRQNAVRELVRELRKEFETADRVLAQDMERQRRS